MKEIYVYDVKKGYLNERKFYIDDDSIAKRNKRLKELNRNPISNDRYFDDKGKWIISGPVTERYWNNTFVTLFESNHDRAKELFREMFNKKLEEINSELDKLNKKLAIVN